MLFGKRDKKKSNERVLDLKARVDALRQADETKREKPRSLDRFLKGDDVKTARETGDDYTPAGFSADEPATASGEHDYEAALVAELERLIQRDEERLRGSDSEERRAYNFDDAWTRERDHPGGPSDADRAWNVHFSGPERSGDASMVEDITPPEATSPGETRA